MSQAKPSYIAGKVVVVVILLSVLLSYCSQGSYIKWMKKEDSRLNKSYVVVSTPMCIRSLEIKKNEAKPLPIFYTIPRILKSKSKDIRDVRTYRTSGSKFCDPVLKGQLYTVTNGFEIRPKWFRTWAGDTITYFVLQDVDTSIQYLINFRELDYLMEMHTAN